MTLGDLSEIASSISVIIAAATFVLAQLDKRKTATRSKIVEWQKVVVYGMIRDGVDEFDGIRMSYLIAAQQYGEDLPKQEIQDSTLNKILLDLMSSNVIARSDDGRYLPVVSRTEDDMDVMKKAAMSQFMRQQNESKVLSSVYDLLERDSGNFNMDSLYRKTNAQEHGFPFDNFHILVRSMIDRGSVVAASNGALWLRTKIPQKKPDTANNKTD